MFPPALDPIYKEKIDAPISRLLFSTNVMPQPRHHRRQGDGIMAQDGNPRMQPRHLFFPLI
jgi:hypothetical protein